MGLSSKQVSSRGLDWNQALLESQNLELPKAPNNLMRKNQQQQISHNQQPEPLKCPRCDSTNTKFCYYNNYNKSQPRHFCRACKRHWTKGGTLRNVPVGGGRKNKRVKKSSTTNTATTSTSHITIQPPLAVVDEQKNMNSSLYQGLIKPPSFLLQQNLMSNRGIESKDFGIGNNNGIFLGSSFPPPPPLPQSRSLIFPFSTTSSSTFDTNTCSVSTSLQSSNVYNNCGEEFRTMEETTISSIMPISSTNSQPWEMLPPPPPPSAAAAATSVSVGMEMSNYWSWEDLDSLVSTDLNNNPWDDDIKP